jgi:predicted NAD-dependent protein-ADP-ribosyltransferase YbiA (DUF1768 family)
MESPPIGNSSGRDVSGSRRDYWTALKTSLMLAALLWMLVYRLSEVAPTIPDFVYANF